MATGQVVIVGRGAQAHLAKRRDVLHVRIVAPFALRLAYLYDLILNTGILDLESAVEVIAIVLERKARRLSLPAQELGPAIGLPHYPGRPEDFRPPQT